MGRRLGQHFLNAPWVAKKLIDSLHVIADEVILEIGPGKGALTKELLATGNRVRAIEKDPRFVATLQEMFRTHIASSQLEITEQDIRDFRMTQFSPYVVAANIPYYITGEIIRQFLESAHQPRALALLVQKEVAERIVARDGKESILSLSVKAFGKPSLIARVPRGCFNPPPSVDSAIVLVEHISREFFADISEKRFFEVIKTGFSQKRKLLAGNLAKKYGKELVRAAFAKCDVPEKVRAEDVPLETWKCLVRNLN